MLNHESIQKSIEASRRRELIQVKAVTDGIKDLDWPLNPLRALRLIEVMALHADAALMSPKEIGQFIDSVYTIAHAGGNPICNDKHPSFIEEALEIEKSFVEHNELPEWMEK